MGPRMGLRETLPPPAGSLVDRPVIDCGVMARRFVIVGGGLMGLSAAFHLRRADPGAVVTVFERERALALASLARWPDLDRELEAPTGYRRGGGLRLALDDAAWGAAPAWVAEQRADGVPVDLVDADAARRLAPGIAPACRGGVHCPMDGAGRCDGHRARVRDGG